MPVENCANPKCPRNKANTGTQCDMQVPGEPKRWFCSEGCIGDFILEAFVAHGQIPESMLEDFRLERRAWRE
jgi:hypothetical protein